VTLWHRSRTIRLGAATVALALVDAVLSGLGWWQVVLAVVGAAGVWLRTLTTTPISGGPRPTRRPPTVPRSGGGR
jgi:hypothetical protein